MAKPLSTAITPTMDDPHQNFTWNIQHHCSNGIIRASGLHGSIIPALSSQASYSCWHFPGRTLKWTWDSAGRSWGDGDWYKLAPGHSKAHGLMDCWICTILGLRLWPISKWLRKSTETLDFFGPGTQCVPHRFPRIRRSPSAPGAGGSRKTQGLNPHLSHWTSPKATLWSLPRNHFSAASCPRQSRMDNLVALVTNIPFIHKQSCPAKL